MGIKVVRPGSINEVSWVELVNQHAVGNAEQGGDHDEAAAWDELRGVIVERDRYRRFVEEVADWECESDPIAIRDRARDALRRFPVAAPSPPMPVVWRSGSDEEGWAYYRAGSVYIPQDAKPLFASQIAHPIDLDALAKEMAVPALVAEIERLVAELEAAQDILETVADGHFDDRPRSIEMEREVRAASRRAKGALAARNALR